MNFYLQQGHGMMGLCQDLVGRWGGGTVILSPRDLTSDQLDNFAWKIRNADGRVLVDPQFYAPRATHTRLLSHDYWPDAFSTDMLLGGPGLRDMLLSLREVNERADTELAILPGVMADRTDGDWQAYQRAIVDEGASVFSEWTRYATISVSCEVLRSEADVEGIVEASEQWDVDGFYVVPESPAGSYLVDDPIWIGNLMILCSGLKLQARKVLILSLARTRAREAQ